LKSKSTEFAISAWPHIRSPDQIKRFKKKILLIPEVLISP